MAGAVGGCAVSRYREQMQAEDAAAAAKVAGQIGAKLRGRGLTQKQVDAVLGKVEQVVSDAVQAQGRGRHGDVVFRRRDAR